MRLLRAETYHFLFAPKSPATLGLLRIAYGILMLWEFWHVKKYMMGITTNSKFFLTYDFFHWVKPMAPETLDLCFTIGAVAAVMLILGFMHRVSALVVFLFWTYLFLLCRGHYTNHYYLFCLVGFWIWFTDSNRWASLDSLLYAKLPWTRKWILGFGDVNTVPYWQVLALQLQLFVVYFYGGLAKIYPDWLQGYPMRLWLPQREWLPSFMHTPAGGIFMSWSGMVFDLAIGFVLMSKYRKWGLPFVVFFHITNEMIFRTIGGFPHFMGAATLIFFDPAWPVELGRKLLPAKEKVKSNAKKAAQAVQVVMTRGRKVVLGFLLLFAAWQFLYPFRHFLYPGDPSITGEGAVFGWRMMLTTRDYGAKLKVKVDGETFYITGDSFFHYMNFRQFTRLCRTPKAIHRFALFIQDEMHKTNPSLKPEIYGYLMVRLNGRPYSQVIDTTVNLLAQPYKTLGHIDWVRTEPFEEPPGQRYLDPNLMNE